jgi:penicillin-binding protein 1A
VSSFSSKRVKRWIAYSFGLVAIALALMLTVVWFTLPSLDVLTDYRPLVPLRVYTADGYLIKEIGAERREVVKIENVPAVLKQALIATEDEGFYKHIGIEPSGIARAVLAFVRTGRATQGASTITQQVARNFFLTRDKTLDRKVREALLAIKIERNLGKDKILELYINQIYLGQRAYGFEVAARTYFGKRLAEISLAEAAMLAGLPKAPATGNPITNPTRAKNRQKYVLGRMVKAKFINETQAAKAREEPIRTTSGTAARELASARSVHAEYVAEIARQKVVEQFGEKATQIGIKVITTITRAEQEAAYESLRQGVMDYDRRHGYRGPEKYLTLPDDDANVDPAIAVVEDDDDLPPDYGDLLTAVVLRATPKEVTAYRHGETLRISGAGLSFAAPKLNEEGRQVRRGAVVRIRKTGNKGWELTQLPEVESALVSVDSRDGAVRALVGGFDFGYRQFNNVTNARRQPGSSFKPFIYSASLERGYAPGTPLADEPLYYPKGVAGNTAWEPHNYEGKFDGMMTLREALTRSKNIPAVRVLEDITPAYARSYIERFGFDPDRQPPYLTMALGAGSVSPWEMASGYAVFANGGYRVNPYIVKEILDADGKPVVTIDPPAVAGEDAPRVIEARNAWIMDSMLRDVIMAPRGTGGRARSLGRRDLAGKSGTTSDYVDAWFCGYNPQLVAVAWFGFPKPRNLGQGETGGTAALGIWINYMRTALASVPETFLPRPAGIASSLAGDGSREDYYYEDARPPELLPPPEGGSIDIPLPSVPNPDAPPSPFQQIQQAPSGQAAPVEERVLE